MAHVTPSHWDEEKPTSGGWDLDMNLLPGVTGLAVFKCGQREEVPSGRFSAAPKGWSGHLVEGQTQRLGVCGRDLESPAAAGPPPREG